MQQHAFLEHLRDLNATKGRPVHVWQQGDDDWKSKLAVVDVLAEHGFVRKILDSAAPGRPMVELTSAGLVKAEHVIHEKKLSQRLTRVNWLGWATLGAAVLSVAATFWTDQN